MAVALDAVTAYQLATTDTPTARRQAGLPTLAQMRNTAVDAITTCDRAGLAAQLDKTIQNSLGQAGLQQIGHLRYTAPEAPTPPAGQTGRDHFWDEHVQIIAVPGF